MSKRKALYAGLAAVVLGAPLLWVSTLFLREPEEGLESVHETIAASMPEVEHITADEFSGREAGSLIIFDTREADEFAVSHLPGAIRISPDMPPADFLQQYGDRARGKVIVFYCSVGARSSQYASDVQAALSERGAVSVANLQGGLFGWHNDKRLLVTGEGDPTDAIHPYDEFWGRLIERKSLIAMSPE